MVLFYFLRTNPKFKALFSQGFSYNIFINTMGPFLYNQYSFICQMLRKGPLLQSYLRYIQPENILLKNTLERGLSLALFSKFEYNIRSQVPFYMNYKKVFERSSFQSYPTNPTKAPLRILV